MNGCTAWFAGKDFTTDWVSLHLETWERLAAEIRPEQPHVLEIGSWEGRSAVAWLNLLPRCHITCIDRWYREPEREARFDRNTAPFGTRVRKIAAQSSIALAALIAERRSFDLIYVDGEHSREGTLRDSVLAWPLLKHGGILLWDDYLWELDLALNDRPQQAIDWFICAHQRDLAIIHRGYQIAGIRHRDSIHEELARSVGQAGTLQKQQGEKCRGGQNSGQVVKRAL
jgi:predicted O-methyltransferase YrrM